MRALPLMVGAICVLAIGYRYYSAFLSARVLSLDDRRPTPAHRRNDGRDFVPTHRWILFGHHFAAITGAGPLVGPTLACQFGFLPGYLWILIGVVIGGATHDFIILVSSLRRDGRSIVEIARREIGPTGGLVASVSVVLILFLLIAAMARVVVNALAESAWGTFTIGSTIPIALFVGLYLHRIRKGRIGEASLIGVALVLAAVVAGKWVAASSVAPWFLLSEHDLIIAIALYGFVASVLPVWMLLCPRDYLSAYLKIGTIAALVIGILVTNPALKMPAISAFLQGGPIVPGKLFPFVFITIACGAISGFHGLIASGTTPKMLDKETDARPIAYGAMLTEALVAVVALIAAASLAPGDYFAINTPPGTAAALGFTPDRLPSLSQAIGERLEGRAGGAVSLAVGISQVFSGLPGLSSWVSYWYHFAIMFEALFILTTVDTGTRVARFLVQEVTGWARGRTNEPVAGRSGPLWASLVVCAGWGYLVWTGSIRILWPLLGITNQLLACIGLCTVSTVLVNEGKARYLWTTLVPLAFVGVATETAGFQLIRDGLSHAGHGYVLVGLCLIAMTALIVIVACSVVRWMRPWSGAALNEQGGPA